MVDYERLAWTGIAILSGAALLKITVYEPINYYLHRRKLSKRFEKLQQEDINKYYRNIEEILKN